MQETNFFMRITAQTFCSQMASHMTEKEKKE